MFVLRVLLDTTAKLSHQKHSKAVFEVKAFVLKF